MRTLATFAVVLCFITSAALAQTELATLTGSVIDPSGAVLKDATVTVTNEATNVSASTVSNETGRYEVWLEPLPRTTVRYRITSEGGSHPLWLPDGRALYFDRDRQLFRLALNLDGPAPSGKPVPLPIKGFVQGEFRRQFDLMPDGRQFVVLMPLPN